MAKTAKDYSVTTPYGKVAGYPLNNGYHYGEDRAMPVGTPIVVNGVKIGTSGKTGYVTGPHLHIGKWASGKSYNPNGGGFTFKSATVTQVDLYDNDANGRYVRIQADGYSWVYLHMDTISVKTGQVLKPASTYPRTVRVTKPWGAYVRSKPMRSAPLAGSRYLPYLSTFTAVKRVKGEAINGNPYWYQSSRGNYVWTGNCN